MKTLSKADLHHLADQLERTARIIRDRGDEAVRRAGDWSGAALRSTGTDPGRGKGTTSDPTQNAAFRELEHPDPNAEQLILLSSEAGRAFDAVVTLESRLIRIATDRVTEPEKAGIGWCHCGRYCDGSASSRLRNGQCPACDQKERRENRKQAECDHASTVWHHGELSCADCGFIVSARIRAV